MIIYSDGRVSICDNDWYGKSVIGNINNNTLRKIWFSGRLVMYRKLHIIGLKKTMSVCRECSYRPLNSLYQNKEFQNV